MVQRPVVTMERLWGRLGDRSAPRREGRNGVCCEQSSWYDALGSVGTDMGLLEPISGGLSSGPRYEDGECEVESSMWKDLEVY